MKDQGLEIWFERVFWSYMPCHWKGWGVLALVSGSVIFLNLIVVPMLSPSHGFTDDVIGVASIGLAITILTTIAKSHSRSA
jgi:hypothetical protein